MKTKYSTKLLKQGEIISEKLQKIRSCRGILLIGSAALGTADKYSDLDLIFLYSREPSDKLLEATLDIEGISKFWLDKKRFHVHLKNEELGTVAVLFTKYDGLKKKINLYPEISINDYKELSKYIATAKVLYGDKRVFNAWQKKCKKFPKKLKEKLVKNRLASIRFWFKENNIEALIKRGDWLMFNKTLSLAVEWSLEIIYTLNNEVYINPKHSKKLLKSFKKKPKNILKRLENLYKVENNKENAAEKVAQMESLFDDLESLI